MLSPHTGSSAPSPEPAALRYPKLWRPLIVIHGLAAVIVLWLLPGGFPFWHPRFWTNRTLPLMAVAIFVIGTVGIYRGWSRLVHVILLGLTVAAAAGLVTAVILFPFSSKRIWPLLLCYAAILGTGWLFETRGRRVATLYACLAMIGALALGTFVVWSQRAPEPDTVPCSIAAPSFEPSRRPADVPATIALGERMLVRPGAGSLAVRYNKLTIEIEPLLHFESRSPDRCWINLAPRHERDAPTRRLMHAIQGEKSVQIQYRDLADHVLQVFLPEQASDSAAMVSIEAFSTLESPVFSHLNSFCDLTIAGHRRLAFSFSPCPNQQVEVLPFDYPTGRPARLAYVDDVQIFHVVEATSGEKGPFHELARGPLPKDAALAITCHDDGQAVCRIRLEDWAAQVGRSLSPTAGWGLPVNAIEFSLTGDSAQSSAAVFITLAGTSVGRDWDSVGHSAGTYRNRVRVDEVQTKGASVTVDGGLPETRTTKHE